MKLEHRALEHRALACLVQLGVVPKLVVNHSGYKLLVREELSKGVIGWMFTPDNEYAVKDRLVLPFMHNKCLVCGGIEFDINGAGIYSISPDTMIQFKEFLTKLLSRYGEYSSSGRDIAEMITRIDAQLQQANSVGGQN